MLHPAVLPPHRLALGKPGSQRALLCRQRFDAGAFFGKGGWHNQKDHNGDVTSMPFHRFFNCY
jgi:hypothetical protein